TENATSSGNTTITNATSLTQTSGTTLAVGGTFTNSVGGGATTWTDSTLYLYSGTSYSMNTKSAGADTYGTLLVAGNTDVRVWNSSSATTTVNATGSLYSQDHAAVDGDLYVWGGYESISGEYWNYANDFDGTALGGSSRQARIRFAPGSSFTATTSTVRIVGSASATTSIDVQGSGTYSFGVSGGTLNAQYYQFRNTDALGVQISGTPTVTSLANGDFELAVNGGSSLTLAHTAINQNPALQIQQVAFGTSSGITSGSNVTETGTPSSFWWFRNHSGNYDGESYDTDPGGNPGFIRWDDSGFSITVSGNVYSDHGSTPLSSPTCDGSTAVVTIVVNGATSYTGDCDTGTGEYSIPGVSFTGDAIFTAYLNTNGGARAVSVTKTATADITGLNLYERALILRHEDSAAITIEDLALFDSTNDSDVFFAAATGSPDTLITEPETELFIATGKTFAPGGNITLQSGGGGDARDGRLELAASAVFTAAGTESHALGGGLTIGSGATFGAASSTLTFAATTSGKIITSGIPLTLYNLVFNGSGGGWSVNSSGTTTVQNGLTMTAGTLSGTGSIAVQSGGVTGNGQIAMTSGTFEVGGTANLGGNTAWTFSNLTLGNGTAGTITKTGSGTTTVGGVLRIAGSETLQAGSSAWILSGGGTPFIVSGNFSVQTAPFFYTATTSTNIADTTYAALTLAPQAAGSPTFTLQGGTLASDDLTFGDGTNPVTVTANTNDPSIAISDDIVIATNATLIASNVGAFEVGGSWVNTGTFTHSSSAVLFESTDTGETITPGGSSFNNLTFDGIGGGWTITENATSSGNTTITNATSLTQTSGTTLAVG
ncbi:MAG: hypothetical protein WAZ27_02030, partial [Minisyncoccia bacterium]